MGLVLTCRFPYSLLRSSTSRQLLPERTPFFERVSEAHAFTLECQG